MRKLVVALMLLCFVSVGCTGSFMLTKKVYNWHRSMGDKWADEFGFLVCALLPIYGLSTFADAIVFNSIEFWTGKNPVEAKADSTTKFVKVGDEQATLSFNKTTNEMSIASQKNGLHPAAITLAKSGNSLVTKDKNGNVLFTTVKNDNGEFMVYGKDSRLIKVYTPEEISNLTDEKAK